MKISSSFLIALIGVSLVQCAPKVGIIGPAGFEQPQYEYRLAYRDPTQKQFLGADWQLDNYYMDPAWNRLKPKEGPEYVAERQFDENGDGIISSGETDDE